MPNNCYIKELTKTAADIVGKVAPTSTMESQVAMLNRVFKSLTATCDALRQQASGCVKPSEGRAVSASIFKEASQTETYSGPLFSS